MKLSTDINIICSICDNKSTIDKNNFYFEYSTSYPEAYGYSEYYDANVEEECNICKNKMIVNLQLIVESPTTVFSCVNTELYNCKIGSQLNESDFIIID